MNLRVMQATQELDTARKNLRQAERESRRDRRPLPPHLYQHHMATIRLLEANLDQALAAAGAMSRFPSVRRAA